MASSLPSLPAAATLYDASDNLFGELLDPAVVCAASASSSHSQPPQLRSLEYGYPVGRSPSPSGGNSSSGGGGDVPLKVLNLSSSFARIRWVDDEGRTRETHTWTLAPGEEWRQTTRAGHVFAFSAIVERGERDLFDTDEEREVALGAYRPKRTLPSRTDTRHSIEIHDGDDATGAGEDVVGAASYILEVVLTDETGYDALVVAAYWVDRQVVQRLSRHDALKTLGLLQKVIANVIADPNNKKFRRLRLSNTTVQQNLGRHWATCEFLRVLGFRRHVLPREDGGGEEEYLVRVNAPDGPAFALYAQSATLLEQLSQRCRPGFVADLAPATPWEEPVLLGSMGIASRSGGGSGRWGDAGSTNFMSDEDRWARVERARHFRGRAGPVPSPGNAPSDRGRWGRGR